MRIKKIVINIIILMTAFAIFVTWHQYNIRNEVKLTSSLIIYDKVYLITTDKEYEYWNFINQGAADMAAAIGINYIWDAPAKRNVIEQINIINRAVNDGANALLVAADDPRRVSGAIEDAKARGVKIIYVDSPANEEAITTLSTNNYDAGVAAGQTLISLLSDSGIVSGSIGIVSIASKQNAELRESGFRKVILSDGRYHLLDTLFTNGEPASSEAAANKIINENEDLIALFGTNEGTTVGVGNANKSVNNRIVGIGFDKTQQNMELLKNGSLKAIIAQNPYTMGYLGMAEAVAALLGKRTGPPYLNTGFSVLKSD